LFSKTTFYNWKSWVLTWLFLSIAFSASWAEFDDQSITRLVKERFPKGDSRGTTVTGIALTVGSNSAIYALYDSPLRIIVWQPGQTTSQEFDISSSISSTPTDLANDGGFGLLMVDPWENQILHFDHRLQQMQSVIPQLGDQRFEPFSICRSIDGALFVINRADDDLWKIERDGLAVPFGWSPSASGKLSNPKRIRYNSQIDRFVILDDNYLLLVAPGGGYARKIPLRLEAASGVALSEQEIWVVGDGMECISIATKSESYFVPPDSLKEWGVFPAVDVTIDNDGFIYILSGFDGAVLKFEIQRVSSEHP